MKFLDSVKNSTKLVDVEEWFDLYFSRPLGLLLAKCGARLGISPNAVSFLSMLSGIASGLLLFFQSSFLHLVIAAILLVFAGLLDSADGQLARILGTSSRLGMILDGTVDNIVFVSVYIGATFHILPEYGLTIIIWSALAGVMHSLKSLIYDVYKLDYLYFFTKDKKCRIPSKEEVALKRKGEHGFSKVLINLYYDYVKKQNRLGTRAPAMRAAFADIAFDPGQRGAFLKLYREEFLPLLSWWALFCGTNFHRTMLIVFILLGRFDLYLVIQIATLIPFLIIRLIQKKKDLHFLESFNSDYSLTKKSDL